LKDEVDMYLMNTDEHLETCENQGIEPRYGPNIKPKPPIFIFYKYGVKIDEWEEYEGAKFTELEATINALKWKLKVFVDGKKNFEY